MEKPIFSPYASRSAAERTAPPAAAGEFGDSLSQPGLWSPPGRDVGMDAMVGSAIEGGFLRLAVWATALVPLALLIWLMVRFYREVP